MTNQSKEEIVILRCLIYSSYSGFYVNSEAIRLHYGNDYNYNNFGLIKCNDPIRTDPKFYDVIQKLGVSKTFNHFGYDISFNTCCPIKCIEFYTHSSPSIIPFELWFTPVIQEYNGFECVKDIIMHSPQIQYMKKIQQIPGLTAEERCLKYEEIFSLEPPVIQHRKVELQDIIPNLKM